MKSLEPNVNEIRRAITLLFLKGQVVEVRIPTPKCVVSGYFDDHDLLAQTIQQADVRYKAAGVYYVINEIDPALLARAYNRLVEGARHTTTDANVKRRRRLPIDFDPVRPAGISSSDAEHDAAIERARRVSSEAPKSWGTPILADSGNGAHLLYAIDFPNDLTAHELVSKTLTALDRRYSDDLVKVDVTCGNAARIWKAYGTVARKGDSIPGRPHRLSRILETPE